MVNPTYPIGQPTILHLSKQTYQQLQHGFIWLQLHFPFYIKQTLFTAKNFFTYVNLTSPYSTLKLLLTCVPLQLVGFIITCICLTLLFSECAIRNFVVKKNCFLNKTIFFGKSLFCASARRNWRLVCVRSTLIQYVRKLWRIVSDTIARCGYILEKDRITKKWDRLKGYDSHGEQFLHIFPILIS